MRRRPYSVLLLDEIEKAHRDVFNVLLQLLDDGRLTDSHGRTVDFTNTIVVMTSNIGSQTIMDLAGQEDDKEIERRVMHALRKEFLPEFLNRVDETIVFHPLTKHEIRQIVDLQLVRLQKRLEENGYTLEVTDAAKKQLAEEGYDPVYGARPLKRVIQQRTVDPKNWTRKEGGFPEFCFWRIEMSGQRKSHSVSFKAKVASSALPSFTSRLRVLTCQLLPNLIPYGGSK